MKKPPQKIAIRALAELCSLTPRRLYQLADENKIPRSDKGKFPRDETIAALFQWFHRDAEELKREKLLTSKAARKIKERQLCDMENAFLERGEVEATLKAVVHRYHGWVRQQLESDLTQKRKQKLESLGVSSGIIQVFAEYDSAVAIGIISALELQAEKFSKGEDESET